MTPDLIQLIEEDAVLVRQGFFTLAVEKAQEKLKKFQLPDPRYYITQIIQALLANQADGIHLQVEGLNVRITFNGEGYSKQELERISDAVFESGKNRDRDRIRELALGLLSVQALNPREVSISSQGWRWERTPGRGRVVETPGSRNEILIQHRRADTQEQQILRQTCQSCRADITLNDTVISSLGSTRQTGCPWPNYGFKGNGFRGAFGIAYGEIPATHLTLTRYGVVFSKRNETRILPSLIVEMEHEKLRKNASQSDVVEDDSYSAMLAELQRIQLEFALELASKRVPGYQAQQVYLYFQELVVQNLSPELLSLEEQHLSPLEAQLCDAPMFQSADGRRCSARQIWNVVQEYGTVFFTEDHNRLLSSPPGTCLRLSESSANSLRSLFPELQKEGRLDKETFGLRLQNFKQNHSLRLPHAVHSKTVQTARGELEFRIPDESPQQRVDLIVRPTFEVPGQPALERIRLGDSPLGFILVSSQRLTLKPQALEQMIKDYVEPIYQGLVLRLSSPANQNTSLRSIQRAYLHYLEYRYGSLAQAFREPEQQKLPLFHSVQRAPISLDDLRAWLDVYPQVVVSYGASLSQEDHALAVTPVLLEALARTFGQERLKLADLSQPLLLERGQQLGLSGAARAGVRKTEVFDEDAELAAIRKEIELASTGGLQVAEESPLDESAVLRQLGIQVQPNPGGRSPSSAGLSAFCQSCLEAGKSLNRRWQMRFQHNGLHGVLFVEDSRLMSPLRAEQLLVKHGDQEPVAYPLPLQGLGGWLEIPSGWTEEAEFAFPPLRPDSELANPDETWPMPEWLVDLGRPELNADLVWSLRRLFKIAAQHFAGPARDNIPSPWIRRLSQYLRWDAGWAAAQEESWFLRLPLLQNLAGQAVDIYTLRAQTEVSFWAPLGVGRVAAPYQTLRLLPPFERDDLERLLLRPLHPATLELEEKREEQLLSELKGTLVQTCQRSHAPLEPEWVQGLRFGEPTRWFGGPRKYFIKHDLEESTTRLNPADAIFIRLFREQKDWERRVPVLASAVYTAINRAIDEVNDQHELAYLEAMLSAL
ncbi:hypothetical protein JST97_26210 [bacterium]|nr:hypothetical protein [bacterium]